MQGGESGIERTEGASTFGFYPIHRAIHTFLFIPDSIQYSSYGIEIFSPYPYDHKLSSSKHFSVAFSNSLSPKYGGPSLQSGFICLADVRSPYYSGQWVRQGPSFSQNDNQLY